MARLRGPIGSVIHALVLAMFANPALAGGDAKAGGAKAVTCAACHGRDGNSVNPLWPNLAGQHAPYLVKQLKDFRAGNRSDPSMSAFARPLSDQDIEDLAAYFSSQKAR